MLTRIVLLLLLLCIRKPVLEKLLMPQPQSSPLAPYQTNFAKKMQSHRKTHCPQCLRTFFSFQRKRCELTGACEKQSKRLRLLWVMYLDSW